MTYTKKFKLEQDDIIVTQSVTLSLPELFTINLNLMPVFNTEYFSTVKGVRLSVVFNETQNHIVDYSHTLLLHNESQVEEFAEYLAQFSRLEAQLTQVLIRFV